MATDKPERKPRGFGAFSDLMKKLIKVPKEEIDDKPKPKPRKKK